MPLYALKAYLQAVKKAVRAGREFYVDKRWYVTDERAARLIAERIAWRHGREIESENDFMLIRAAR